MSELKTSVCPGIDRPLENPIRRQVTGIESAVRALEVDFTHIESRGPELAQEFYYGNLASKEERAFGLAVLRIDRFRFSLVYKIADRPVVTILSLW